MAANHIQPATKPYGIVIHAGARETWKYDPKKQRDTQVILKKIVARAELELSNGALAIDVVRDAVTALEDCESFNAGRGAVLNIDGEHELEAAIVNGTLGDYRAVAALRRTKNPICLAHAMLFSPFPVLMIGQPADDLAQKLGLEMVENDYFTTSERAAHWAAQKAQFNSAAEDLGTVGAVALGVYANLAAANSTGGMACKSAGRIGDTPIIGAGIYGDRRSAIACSGTSEAILKASLAGKIAAAINNNATLDKAVNEAILYMAKQSKDASCGVIAIDVTASISIQNSSRVFATASATSSSPSVALLSQNTISILTQHQFYEDDILQAGLTRYPTTPTQVAIELQGQVELYALDAYLFKKFFLKVWKLTELLRATAGVSHCGFVSRGDFQSTIIPIYGKGPTRINSYQKDITAILTVLTNGCSRTGAGLQSNNVQTRLRSDREGTQKRVQLDDKHFARYLFDRPSSRPLEIEVGSLDEASTNDSRNAETEWTNLLQATWELMQRVKDEYKVNKFGFMIKPAEKCHVCITLIPTVFSDPSLEMIPSPTTFQETYPGYLTDGLGPLTSEFQDMSANAAILRKSLRESDRVSPPGSWRIPETHSLGVLRSPWYSTVAFVQDSFYHASVNFFGQQLGYKYALVPPTTDCISSPMGLGSDSVPARILLHGGETCLADSMQFSLEYMLRVVEGCKGFYYLSPSFRGEDPDASHLNQFYHAECELRGTLDDGIRVMEQFVFAVTQAIWEKSRQVIESIVEDTSHIQEFLKHSSNDTAFPRVRLEEAIRILSGTDGTWEFVLPDNPEKGKKLTRRGERALMEQYGGIVWVTHMDHLSVPFYQAYTDDSCTKARCADLLMGIGETGRLGERHITPGQVSFALKQHEIPVESYQWYLDIREEVEMQTGLGHGNGEISAMAIET